MSEPTERVWTPGDPLVLPDADESAYPPDAVPLEVAIDEPLDRPASSTATGAHTETP